MYHDFRAWARGGTLNRLHNGLREQIRQAEGRHRSPSAAVVDSRSVRGAEIVPRRSRGYDASLRAAALCCTLKKSPSGPRRFGARPLAAVGALRPATAHPPGEAQ